MSVFLMCDRAIGWLRGNRLTGLAPDVRAMLEALDYEGLAAAGVQDEAVTCARHFAFVRDRLLRQYPWLFARKSATLARLTTAAQGWRFAFALPPDCLKVLAAFVPAPPHGASSPVPFPYPQTVPRLYDNGGGRLLPHWEVLENRLLTNHSNAEVRYTARITDTERWDPAFADAFCAALASEIAAAVTGSPANIQGMEQRAQAAIQEAHNSGAIDRRTGLKLRRNAWADYNGLYSGYEGELPW